MQNAVRSFIAGDPSTDLARRSDAHQNINMHKHESNTSRLREIASMALPHPKLSSALLPAPTPAPSVAQTPLKPILISRTPEESEARRSHKASSSVSSTGSQRQITFELPNLGKQELSSPRATAASPTMRSHHRQASTSSASTSSSPPKASPAKRTSRQLKKKRRPSAETAAAPLPGCAIAPVDRPPQLEPSVLHISKASTRDVVTRPPRDIYSKELPPLPLACSAPASSATREAKYSHSRTGSDASATSSILSNPIHLPRLKLGSSSLGFADENCSPTSKEDRWTAWMGMSRSDNHTAAGLEQKRGSGQSSRRSSRRQSENAISSVQNFARSGPTGPSRASQTLPTLPEARPAERFSAAADDTILLSQQGHTPNASKAKFSGTPSKTREEVMAMTQLWISMLEDFVLLEDSDSLLSSERSSMTSLPSYVFPASSQTQLSLVLPTSSPTDPASPAPSSECCDPYIVNAASHSAARHQYSGMAGASPMPSLVDDSAGSTNTYSPMSPPAERHTLRSDKSSTVQNECMNPFEMSFAASTPPVGVQPDSRRRASLPNTLDGKSGSRTPRKAEKRRPPPLNLDPIADTDETIHYAAPVLLQSEAQTTLFTSQRSRSLPTQDLQPTAHRKPVSPKNPMSAKQLGSSTSSTGSNRLSKRYHFPSSSQTELCFGKIPRRNRSIDEGYGGSGLTPTPTSDTFSIPSRSRECSISSASGRSVAYDAEADCLESGRSNQGSSYTADSSLPSPNTASCVDADSPSQQDAPEDTITLSTANVARPAREFSYTDALASVPSSKTSIVNRTRRSASASAGEQVRRVSVSAAAMKRSPTLEIVMYGVAM